MQGKGYLRLCELAILGMILNFWFMSLGPDGVTGFRIFSTIFLVIWLIAFIIGCIKFNGSQAQKHYENVRKSKHYKANIYKPSQGQGESNLTGLDQMFDFNGDGKLDLGEQATKYQYFETLNKDKK